MKRLRVLISSHEFSPEQGSECAVGWNICSGLAKHHDVTVLCADGAPLWRDSYRSAVERRFKNHGPVEGLRVVFVEQPPETLRYARLNRHLMKLTGGFGWQPLYYLGLDHWHRTALRKAQALGIENFDALHQLTPISFIRPGHLWTTGKPFFWGPVGGMYKVPEAFARSGGLKSRLFETVRSLNIESRIQAESFRAIVKTAKRIWVVTEAERRIVDGIAEGKACPMVDTSPPSDISGRVRKYQGEEPLRLCWSGGHEPWKALPLLLHAIASLPDRNRVVLDVLGRGPEEQKWKSIAGQLGLKNVTWHGRLPHREALNTMDSAHVFVHTSWREAASMVVLEALGWGLPVICHDACGMAVAVDETCGIKVPLVHPDLSIEGFHKAIATLLDRPELVSRLSEGALRRAGELSWKEKAEAMSEAYRECI